MRMRKVSFAYRDAKLTNHFVIGFPFQHQLLVKLEKKKIFSNVKRPNKNAHLHEIFSTSPFSSLVILGISKGIGTILFTSCSLTQPSGI